MITRTILCSPTYSTSRKPITARRAGIRIVSEGIIGTTLSKEYDGSVGGVVKGSENICQMLEVPRSFPSIKYDRANPNMRFVKNAPKRNTFVICQMIKFGTLSL